MTQSFNPFATQASVQPQAPAALPQQRAIPQGLDDAGMYDGFSTPFFKHLEGTWDCKVVGYTGARSPKLGIACHITVEIVRSSTPDAIPVGSTWRIAYKYDFERAMKADKDMYGSDARSLGNFVQALCNRKSGPDFSVAAAEASLRAHDFTLNPGMVTLIGSFGKPKVKAEATGGQSVTRYRNDTWLPFKAA